jgi:hypothetical protein
MGGSEHAAQRRDAREGKLGLSDYIEAVDARHVRRGGQWRSGSVGSAQSPASRSTLAELAARVYCVGWLSTVWVGSPAERCRDTSSAWVIPSSAHSADSRRS